MADRMRALGAPSPHVIDASGLVLGRAASLVAKRLLNGETIVVVHAEKCVIIGSRTEVIRHYTEARARGSKRTGPHFPRYADRIFRRTVRGMLPHLKTRGKEALGRLEVYLGVPPEYQKATPESLASARPSAGLRSPTTLGDVTRLLGARS